MAVQSWCGLGSVRDRCGPVHAGFSSGCRAAVSRIRRVFMVVHAALAVVVGSIVGYFRRYHRSAHRWPVEASRALDDVIGMFVNTLGVADIELMPACCSVRLILLSGVAGG